MVVGIVVLLEATRLKNFQIYCVPIRNSDITGCLVDAILLYVAVDFLKLIRELMFIGLCKVTSESSITSSKIKHFSIRKRR